jgi:hypothetical protein
MRSVSTAPASGAREALLQSLSAIERADPAQFARTASLLEAWLDHRAAVAPRGVQDEIEDELEAEDLRAATRALWRAGGSARRCIAEAIELAVLRAGDPPGGARGNGTPVPN